MTREIDDGWVKTFALAVDSAEIVYEASCGVIKTYYEGSFVNFFGKMFADVREVSKRVIDPVLDGDKTDGGAFFGHEFGEVADDIHGADSFLFWREFEFVPESTDNDAVDFNAV